MKFIKLKKKNKTFKKKNIGNKITNLSILKK